MKKLLKNFKKTKAYSFFVKHILKKLINILWKYLINFLGNFLLIFWRLIRKSKNCYQLDKNKGVLLIKKDEQFEKIVEIVSTDLDQNKLKDVKNEIILNNQSSEFKNFTKIVTEKLNNKSLKAIFDLATSEKILNTASNYLGVFPILSLVQVYYNIPVDGKKLEGSKLWHQDGFGYKSLDFFIPLSNIDDDSGPLFVSENHPEYGIFLKFKNSTKSSERWKSGRVTLEEFSKTFSENQIHKLNGISGGAILCDSFQCYHRGGACSKKDRLMLRLSYQTPDAIRLKKPLDFLVNYKLSDENILLKILQKYLLNYRGLISENIKEKLVHFYHLMTFVR